MAGNQTTVAWHAQPLDDVLAELRVDPAAGLSGAEAAARLVEHGPNALPEPEGRPLWRLVLAQFTDLMVLVLLAAAVVSAATGDVQDSAVILIIVVLNAAIGSVQEYRAEQAMAALREMAAPTALVRRDGDVAVVPATDVVPGDVVLLEAGSVVPADLRLAEVARLQVAEAALTGESQPVDKRVAALADPDLPIGDRIDMAYRGTVVTYGRGVGVAVATGARTELGRIAELLARSDSGRTPLQRRLDAFGRRLAVAILLICALVFAVGLLRGGDPALMFLTAVSLAVAAIPEALPAVVTISLALGARRMVREKALIRHLPAVETLGSVTVICTDKTGTLTANRMTAVSVEVADQQVADLTSPGDLDPHVWQQFLSALVLANDSTISAEGEVRGDPTETALVELAVGAGLDPQAVRAEWPRVAELPFDSERKRMTTVHEAGGVVLSVTKGAPESVLPCCASEATREGPAPLDVPSRLTDTQEMAATGLRVLAVAARLDQVAPEPPDRDLLLLGLVGLRDPLRPEASPAVAEAVSAGIRTVMVTGDHPATAQAIAVEAGLLPASDDASGTRLDRLTGRELDAQDDTALQGRVRDVAVYARVDPAAKIRIVEAWQTQGEIVAMTGDGVNDAPALKQADIGVAMGLGGTDVAREAADMVLLDDNFATIVKAVREGRRIYDNVRKFIRYAMTGNSGEIWTIFLAPFLGLPIPLLPIQILWVNLVTDGLPGLALANEPAEPDVMRRPPRRPTESVFAQGMGTSIVGIGLLIAALCLGAQAWTYRTRPELSGTMVFTILTFAQLFVVMALRSERHLLWKVGVGTNPFLLASVVGSVGIQLAVVYWAPLQRFFHTEALPLPYLVLCFVLGLVVFVAVEVEKAIRHAGRE